MDLVIRLGTEKDIDELEHLYDALNDYLSNTTNYPGWIKGVYPVRENAAAGIDEGCLYVATSDGEIVGSIILRHEPEAAYLKAKWQKKLEYGEVLVIYTFVVHPDYLKQGIGQAILCFADEHCRKANIKSIRLDVYERNLPAMKLYEKCGYKYIDTVDLGLGKYGLNWFKLYEKLLWDYEYTNEEAKNIVGEMLGIPTTALEFTALRYKLEGSANPYKDALNHIKDLKAEELVAEQNGITMTIKPTLSFTAKR